VIKIEKTPKTTNSSTVTELSSTQNKVPELARDVFMDDVDRVLKGIVERAYAKKPLDNGLKIKRKAPSQPEDDRQLLRKTQPGAYLWRDHGMTKFLLHMPLKDGERYLLRLESTTSSLEEGNRIFDETIPENERKPVMLARELLTGQGGDNWGYRVFNNGTVETAMLGQSRPVGVYPEASRLRREAEVVHYEIQRELLTRFAVQETVEVATH